MARAIKTDRLSPPLLYAFRAAHEARDATKKLDLRDEGGERLIAGRRAPARAAITESVLRKEVARDLEMLMNTVNLASSVDLAKFEHVRRSIVNYGLPDIAHRSIDELGVSGIAGEIAVALRDFEPRLLPNSIDVTRDTSASSEELKLRFVIRADLSCDPIDVPVEFVADLELDSGKISIERT